jgi:hypothetical protein
MEQIFFIEIKESITLLSKHRDNLLDYLINVGESETVLIHYPHYTDEFRNSAPVQISQHYNRLTPEKIKAFYNEIVGLNHVLEALSVLNNFYNGSTIPWSEISEDFFKILDMSIRVPRPYEIKDYKLL